MRITDFINLALMEKYRNEKNLIYNIGFSAIQHCYVHIPLP